MVFIDVTFYPADRWSLEVNALWNGWSDYDALVIEYDNFITPEVRREKDWDDVWRFQVGVEYKATDWLDLRLGYVFDESPVPDETADYLIPTEDRQLYSIGCGMHWNAWVVDLSYTYLKSDTRTVDARVAEGIFPSKFEDGDTHLVGVSVSYIF
jgi:long-chain fatty acid transport protein